MKIIQGFGPELNFLGWSGSKWVVVIVSSASIMSDVSDNEQDFENPKKRKTDDDDEEPAATKRGKKKDEPLGVGDDEGNRGTLPEISFVRPSQALDAKDIDSTMYAKTQGVKDLCNVLTGCCAVPGIEYIRMTFTPDGMQLDAIPTDSPTMVQAFFNKDSFSEFKVSKVTTHVLSKVTLDNLKKKVAKDVEFLEITTNGAGFTVAGFRTYKTGRKCRFSILLGAMEQDVPRPDLSLYSWNWMIRTSSQQLTDNISFFDDSNEFIRMTIKPDLLEWEGVKSSGAVTISIDQEIESKLTDKYEVIFQKKYLKIVTAAKDTNRTVSVKFNMDENVVPIHFMYELDKFQPASHFSAYIAPCNADGQE